jgi:hypothetical protein
MGIVQRRGYASHVLNIPLLVVVLQRIRVLVVGPFRGRRIIRLGESERNAVAGTGTSLDFDATPWWPALDFLLRG